MNIYLVMAFGGVLGIILHSFKAVRDINKRNSNMTFSMVLKHYWKTEYLSIVASVFCFGVLLFVASEFVNLNKVDNPDVTTPLKERLLQFKLSNFIKVSSVIAGYFSDSLVYSFLGVTEKKLQQKLSEQEPKN